MLSTGSIGRLPRRKDNNHDRTSGLPNPFVPSPAQSVAGSASRRCAGGKAAHQRVKSRLAGAIHLVFSIHMPRTENQAPIQLHTGPAALTLKIRSQRYEQGAPAPLTSASEMRGMTSSGNCSSTGIRSGAFLTLTMRRERSVTVAMLGCQQGRNPGDAQFAGTDLALALARP